VVRILETLQRLLLTTNGAKFDGGQVLLQLLWWEGRAKSAGEGATVATRFEVALALHEMDSHARDTGGCFQNARKNI